MKASQSLIPEDIWVARDKNGDLYLYVSKPIRGNNCWIGRHKQGAARICCTFFSELQWEDNPIKVKLVKAE